jgi:hypothetical protein
MWGATTVRGTATAVALLVVGLAGGYAAASALDADPETQGSPSPVVARSPRIPVDPAPTLVASPETPPLGTGLAVRTGRLGNGGFQLAYPVPAGWARLSSATKEVKWKKPKNPADTFILRIEQVVAREDTIAEMLEERIVDLTEEKDRFHIEERTASSVEFTYVSDGYGRHGFLAWLDVRGTGLADVEVAVTGREVDAEGAAELIGRVTAGMRQV